MEEATPSHSSNKGLMAAVVFLFAVLGWGGWSYWPDGPDGPETKAAAVPRASLPDPQGGETPRPAAERASVQPATLDEVRRAGDGITIIAGQAEPGAEVQILQDGAEIATAKADEAGQFAAVALVPADGQGHVLSLSQNVDGAVILSQEEILLAPLAQIQEAPQTAQTQAAVTLAALPDQPGQPALRQNPKISEPAAVQPIPQLHSMPQPKPTPPVPAQPQEVTSPSDRPGKIPGAGAATRSAPPEKVAILRATAQGVELVEPIAPAPQAMANIVLDTISYSDQGDVELAGRAQDQTAEVRVYLNNTAIANLSVDGAGNWRGALPDVDEGIYTLRVDEVTPTGSVSSRVETPFKRESAAVLAAAHAGEGPLKAITVQPGATLWAIARDRYGDGTLYLRVFAANAGAIRDPDLIYPGQVFDLPE